MHAPPTLLHLILSLVATVSRGPLIRQLLDLFLHRLCLITNILDYLRLDWLAVRLRAVCARAREFFIGDDSC